MQAGNNHKSENITEKKLLDFSLPAVFRSANVVDDAVMGGISAGNLQVGKDGTAIFSGIVSLENDGGFSSVKMRYQSGPLAAYQGISLLVKGDGKVYSLRLKTDNANNGFTYRAKFQTESDHWQTVYLPFETFTAVFRGRQVPEAAALNPDEIQQIGFLIADKQDGPFRLEVASINAYKKINENH